MKMTRAGIVILSAVATTLMLLANGSPMVRKSSADVQKANIGWACVTDPVHSPCLAKRKASVCPTGTEFYCGEVNGVDYTARTCTDIDDDDFSCFPSTPAPCGIIKKCSDDSLVLEDNKETPCNSTYNKCVSGTGIAP